MGVIFTPTGEIQRGVENSVSPEKTVFEILGNIRFLRAIKAGKDDSVQARKGVIAGMEKDLRTMGKKRQDLP
jgi:hypothetical protein